MSQEIEFESLVTKRGERLTLIGLSGSGKTTLAEVICDLCSKNLVVIDPKREWSREGFNVVVRPEELYWQMKWKRFPILYQPGPREFANVELYDRILEMIFFQGNVTLYIDEIAAFTTATRYPQFLSACYFQGRSKGVTTIGATQRPSNIPSCCTSEGTSFCVFSLNRPQDKATVASYVKGYNADKLEEFEFWFYKKGLTKTAVKLVLPDPEEWPESWKSPMRKDSKQYEGFMIA